MGTQFANWGVLLKIADAKPRSTLLLCIGVVDIADSASMGPLEVRKAVQVDLGTVVVCRHSVELDRSHTLALDTSCSARVKQRIPQINSLSTKQTRCATCCHRM